MFLGAQKNPLIETVLLNEMVLLSTHNMFGLRNKNKRAIVALNRSPVLFAPVMFSGR